MENNKKPEVNSHQRTSMINQPSRENEDRTVNRVHPNVRRRLDFGNSEVDEELLHKLQGENETLERERAIEKWNFDFASEVPLKGDWVWEKVPTIEPVPNSRNVMETAVNNSKENRNV